MDRLPIPPSPIHGMGDSWEKNGRDRPRGEKKNEDNLLPCTRSESLSFYSPNKMARAILLPQTAFYERKSRTQAAAAAAAEAAAVILLYWQLSLAPSRRREAAISSPALALKGEERVNGGGCGNGEGREGRRGHRSLDPHLLLAPSLERRRRRRRRTLHDDLKRCQGGRKGDGPSCPQSSFPAFPMKSAQI